MTLPDFLLARIAEDEAAAKAARDEFESVAGTVPTWGVRQWTMRLAGDQRCAVRHIARHDPARVLAECEAKRRIVHAVQEAEDNPGYAPDPDYWIGVLVGWEALRFLAIPYTDHPDYSEEWRP